MKDLNRRDLFVALSAFAAMGVGVVEGQAVVGPGETVLAQSETFPFDKLPVNKSANGGGSRAVVQGVLATGELVEMHETTLPPGQMPHPPHKHRHSEFMMIRQGTLEWDMDGKLERVGHGGVLFAASNKMHGIKNVGIGDALYFVIAIGRDTAGMTPVSR